MQDWKILVFLSPQSQPVEHFMGCGINYGHGLDPLPYTVQLRWHNHHLNGQGCGNTCTQLPKTSRKAIR